MNVHDLNFPPYIRTKILAACDNMNVSTALELAAQTEQSLLRNRNFGKGCLNAVKDALQSAGLTLDMNEATIRHLVYAAEFHEEQAKMYRKKAEELARKINPIMA
jgi:hypothetical protein